MLLEGTKQIIALASVALLLFSMASDAVAHSSRQANRPASELLQTVQELTRKYGAHFESGCSRKRLSARTN